MTNGSVSFAGNLTDDPEVRYTGWDRPGPVPGGGVGSAGAGAVVLHRGRVRDQAEQAAESLAKGSQVVVMGRLQHRTWTDQNGSARSTVEVVADELGPSLLWATATTTRATRSQT